MTNEQIKALAALRAAFVAAETTGLTEADVWKAAVTGLVHPEVKDGRPPGNYNPIANFLDETKRKAHGRSSSRSSQLKTLACNSGRREAKAMPAQVTSQVDFQARLILLIVCH
jgi:hypothetical protein